MAEQRAYQCPGCWSVTSLPLSDGGYECGCGERMTLIDLRERKGRGTLTMDSPEIPAATDHGRFARLALEDRSLLRHVLQGEYEEPAGRWVEDDAQFEGAHLAALPMLAAGDIPRE